MKLPQLPADKANHFFYGAMVFLATAAFVLAAQHMAPATLPSPANAGLVACLVAAAAKEASDWISNRRAALSGGATTHEVSGLDAVSTIAGGLSCYFAAVLAHGGQVL